MNPTALLGRVSQQAIESGDMWLVKALVVIEVVGIAVFALVIAVAWMRRNR